MDLTPWDKAYEDAYGPQRVASYKAEVKKVPALSRVPRGHWRNLWRYPPGRLSRFKEHLAKRGCTIRDEFHYFGYGKHPSREIAEQRAIKALAARPEAADVWIDAEFFPEA